MEIATGFCAPGGCMACGGCGGRSLPADIADLPKLEPILPDSSIGIGPIQAVIRPTNTYVWTDGVIGKPTVITYSFGTAAELLEMADVQSQGDWHQFNEYQKDAWRAAIEIHNNASGVQFIEVSDASSANVTINMQTMLGATSWGAVRWDGTKTFRIEVNARYLEQIESHDYAPGQNDLPVFMLHELGHALGMKHPFMDKITLPPEFDNRGYTVMSTSHSPDGTYRADLSPLDIAALSYFYGTQEAQEALSVQWAQLSGGGLISTGNATGNLIVGIADRDLMLGGGGNDTLDGGAGNDRLLGEAHDDVLRGSGGADALLGGSGNDTLFGGADADVLDGGEGVNFLDGGAGTDTLRLASSGGSGAAVRIAFTDLSPVAAANGRSGIAVIGERVEYFSNIEMFEISDGVIRESSLQALRPDELEFYAYRMHELAFGSAPPGAWFGGALDLLSKGEIDLRALAKYITEQPAWNLNFGNNEGSASVWQRAYGMQMPEEIANISRIVGQDAILLYEITIALEADKFMRAGFSLETRPAVGSPSVDPCDGVQPGQAGDALRAIRYHEVLEEGEYTYGFSVRADGTVQAQRTIDEIVGLNRDNGITTVTLSQLRSIELPVTDRVHLIDGVLDFRESGVLTLVTRVYEALYGRDAPAALSAQLKAFAEAGNVDAMLESVVNVPAFTEQFVNISANNFAYGVLRALLGEEPSLSAVNNVLNRLRSGETRQSVTIDLIRSDAVIERLAVTSSDGIFIKNFADRWAALTWDAVFNRDIFMPQRDFSAEVIHRGGSLQSLVDRLFNSPEAQARFNRFGDEDFAKIIFQNVTGGMPDQSELSVQLQRLAGGMTRQQLITAILLDHVNSEAGSLPVIEAGRLSMSVDSAWAQIRGTEGSDTLKGGIWSDAISAGSGKDRVIFDSLDTWVSGGDGIDVLVVSQALKIDLSNTASQVLGAGVVLGFEDVDANVVHESATIDGSDSPNVLIGGKDGDVIDGRGGDDTLRGNSGGDSLSGGFGRDLLAGEQGDDLLSGAAGHDTLRGGAGADTLSGGAGNDVLDGGIGADRMLGGLNNDIYLVDSTGDLVFEAPNQGIDTVRTTLSTYTLPLNVENLVATTAIPHNLTGNTQSNVITGSTASDTLSGGLGDDTLIGGLGNDLLVGGSGNDTLFGGAGGDILVGGVGHDLLSGGMGSDRFLFNTIDDSTVDAPDRITDFTFGAGTFDRIHLNRIDANTADALDQAFVYRGANFTGAAGDLRVQAQGTGVYVAAGDVNGDGLADFAIIIQSSTLPTEAWFIL